MPDLTAELAQDAPTNEDAPASPVMAEAPAAEVTPEVPAETPVAKAPAVVAAPKRGRGRPRKVAADATPSARVKAKAPAQAKVAAKKVAAKVKPAAPLAKAAAPAKTPITKKKLAAPSPKLVVTPKLAVKRAAAPKAPAPLKETVKMATKTKTPEIAAKLQESFKDAAEKAKAAFGETGEFAKGNLEAVVASTKILATGVKSMGETYVAETKSAYETMTADMKEFTAVKSPTEFFELQSKLMRKNFDAAVATGSKKSEEMLKLVNEAFQPISTRMSLAMEKMKQAA